MGHTRPIGFGAAVLASALSVVACGSSGGTAPRDISITSTSSLGATATTAGPTTAAAPATTAPTTAAPSTAAPTTTAPTTAASPATTVVPVQAGGGCLALLADGLKLERDYSQDVRSFAGADEGAYRARAQALADEARRLGCQLPPGVEDFLR